MMTDEHVVKPGRGGWTALIIKKEDDKRWRWRCITNNKEQTGKVVIKIENRSFK